MSFWSALFGRRKEPVSLEFASDHTPPAPAALRSTCSRDDYLRMANEERGRLATAFGEMLDVRFNDKEFDYHSFPELRYDEMVLSTIFTDLKWAGRIESAGRERFRLIPKVSRASRKKRVQPDYPDYMLPTIPPQGRSFEADEDCVLVKVGEFDCPVCHENLGDQVPSAGPSVVIRFHRAHGVHLWWSIVPHCGKKLLISNTGM